MKQQTRTIASSLVLSILFALVLAVPFGGVASARQGNDDQNNVAVSSETETETENETETEDDSAVRAAAKVRAQQLRTEARAEVEEKRKNRETLSEDKRMKVCENRKTAINNKLNAFTNAADKHFTKLNNINDKIVAFQEKNEIVLTNQDALSADIADKKLKASEAIAALKAVAVDVDCSDPETAVTLSAVRDAAQTARKALHDYRMSLKNLVVAIAQAQSDDTKDEETSTTTDTSTSTSDSTTETTEGAN